MAEEIQQTAPGRGGSFLTKKFHGVPVPLLAVGGGLLAFLGYKWWKNRSAAATSNTTTPSTTSTGDTTGTDSGDYGTGGGYGGGTGGGSSTGTETSGALATDIAALTTAIGTLGTLTPQPITPGATQVAYGTTVANPNGGTDTAAVAALAKAQAALQKAEASGNKKAIANATANVKSASAVVASRNSAGASIPAPAGPLSTPTATKTTPTGTAAQAAPVNQALATSQANLIKAQAAEKSDPSAANKAAVSAHESQVAAGR